MLLLAEPAGDALVVAATRGYAQPGGNLRVRIGEGVIGVVAERRTPMRVGNIGASLRYLQAIRARMQEAGQEPAGDGPAGLPGLPNVQSQLALPLLVKDRLVGVLAVESPKSNAFDELDEVLLRIVGHQAATAIDNARTYQMVDQLTRLKRFFSPAPRRAHHRAAAPTTRSRPIAARSRWSSSICADSPRSRRPPSPRRSWASCATITPRWAGSSSPTRARWSASPATA